MDHAKLHRISSQLLGNGYLLEVAAAIGKFSDPEFTLSDVARATGHDKNVVRTALTKLVAGGLVKQLAPVGQFRPCERQPSSYWASCRRLLDELNKS